MDKYIKLLKANGLDYLIPCLLQMDNQYYEAWQVKKIVGFWIEKRGSNGTQQS